MARDGTWTGSPKDGKGWGSTRPPRKRCHEAPLLWGVGSDSCATNQQQLCYELASVHSCIQRSRYTHTHTCTHARTHPRMHVRAVASRCTEGCLGCPARLPQVQGGWRGAMVGLMARRALQGPPSRVLPSSRTLCRCVRPLWLEHAGVCPLWLRAGVCALCGSSKQVCALYGSVQVCVPSVAQACLCCTFRRTARGALLGVH